MRFFFYALDIGPANNLALIEVEALRRGHSKRSVLAEELGPMSFNNINQPDVIITGLSSFKNEEELALGAVAGEAGVPWVVIADSHRTWSRPAAAGRVGKATLIIATPVESEAAREFGYGRVEYFGGPPTWQAFAVPSSFALKRPSSNAVVIFVGGPKDGRLADELLAAVVASMKDIGGDWWLVFRPHPREDTTTVDPERRQKIIGGVNLLSLPREVEQSDLITTVDLSIFTLGATGAIEAAYRRRPAVYFENEAVRENVRAQTKGSFEWFSAEAGACVKTDERGMTTVIQRLLTPEGVAELRARQEEIYPIPPPDGERVETRIVRFLEELVVKK